MNQNKNTCEYFLRNRTTDMETTPQGRVFARLLVEYVRAERDAYMWALSVKRLRDIGSAHADETAEMYAERTAGHVMHRAILEWIKEQRSMTSDQRCELIEALGRLRHAQHQRNVNIYATEPLHDMVMRQEVHAAANELWNTAQQ